MWKLIIQIGLKLVVLWMDHKSTKQETKKQFVKLVDELTGHENVGDLRTRYKAQLERLDAKIKAGEKASNDLSKDNHYSKPQVCERLTMHVYQVVALMEFTFLITKIGFLSLIWQEQLGWAWVAVVLSSYAVLRWFLLRKVIKVALSGMR